VSKNNKIEGEITAIVLPFVSTEGAVQGAKPITTGFNPPHIVVTNIHYIK
jgi:hypothetical protein